VSEFVLKYKHRAETTDDEFVKEQLTGVIQPYLDYEKAKSAYEAAIDIPPVDADTGEPIKGDLNEYLFEKAKTMFPLGIESILADNVKLQVMTKHRFFLDGTENAPAPNEIRQTGQDSRQITLFDSGKPYIGDVIQAIIDFFSRRIEETGAVKLTEIIRYCADIGLYKNNITLYVLGAAFRFFNRETAVFHDGVCYFRYIDFKDMSAHIMRIFDFYYSVKIRSSSEALLFFDNTMLKERIKSIFPIEDSGDGQFDTLGMVLLMSGKWIVENLRYPVEFTDRTLYELFNEPNLYGGKLRQYSEYFTEARCKELKSEIICADGTARKKITEAVGFDPDTTKHRMSGLPKGHYTPLLYSTENYIKEMMKEPRVI
jgi:hypothetical protein